MAITKEVGSPNRSLSQSEVNANGAAATIKISNFGLALSILLFTPTITARTICIFCGGLENLPTGLSNQRIHNIIFMSFHSTRNLILPICSLGSFELFGKFSYCAPRATRIANKWHPFRI